MTITSLQHKNNMGIPGSQLIDSFHSSNVTKTICLFKASRPLKVHIKEIAVVEGWEAGGVDG